MASEMFRITIDGEQHEVPRGSTILEACSAAGREIPTLCHLEGVCSNASCGVCVVEVAGAKSLVRSCVQKVVAEMEVRTSTARVAQARRTVLELLLANHPADCLSCARNGSCELQALAERLGIRRIRFPRTRTASSPDLSSPSLEGDNDKCILCGRCVAVCENVQSVSAIDFTGRGIRTRVSPFLDNSIENSVCTHCGQCTLVCPTGALTERDETEQVFEAIRDPERTVIVQTAPAIRFSLGEALGMPPGSIVSGQMVAALRRLGFEYVFDTQFAADLTIMEEGSELIQRIREGGVLPMITSCSPGWISFIETFYPGLLPHISSCKSPQQMFGAVAKTYWAEKSGIDPGKLSVVSIMPCTAKKYEARRPEMNSAAAWNSSEEKDGNSYPDVDFALTTRELVRMIRRAGIRFPSLPEEDFDDPLGKSTGAATIFGTTGGVMEAALRTAYELILGRPLPDIEFHPIRGSDFIRSAEVDLDGLPLRIAAVNTLRGARTVLDQLERGESPYHFIEIMTCPGGCIGGGGQPILPDTQRRSARQKAVYAGDRRMTLRKSHENPAVTALYEDFLGHPLGHASHALLHTKYQHRMV